MVILNRSGSLFLRDCLALEKLRNWIFLSRSKNLNIILTRVRTRNAKRMESELKLAFTAKKFLKADI